MPCLRLFTCGSVFPETKVAAKVKRQVWTTTAVDAFFEGLYQVSELSIGTCVVVVHHSLVMLPNQMVLPHEQA